MVIGAIFSVLLTVAIGYFIKRNIRSNPEDSEKDTKDIPKVTDYKI